MTPTASTQPVPSSAADGTPLPELDPALIPNLDELVTEDGAPVDNLYTECDALGRDSESQHQTWLRRCDQQGRVIPTGTERADYERGRADKAAEKLKRLEAQVRSLGIEPEV